MTPWAGSICVTESTPSKALAVSDSDSPTQNSAGRTGLGRVDLLRGGEWRKAELGPPSTETEGAKREGRWQLG